MNAPHPQLAVSTWSLHRALENGRTALLDIPAQAAVHGIGRLEICHFHFPTTDEAYLADLREALDASGVKFFTLLIDDFDVTHPDPEQRKEALNSITHWIGIASQCGAERARVIAGKQPTTEKTLRLSAEGLKKLRRLADGAGVQLVTENWHALLDTPAAVHTLFAALTEKPGLMLDFGNWKGERKYDDLAQIATFATSTHAKAHYLAAGQMDSDDFTRCLDICRAAGFSGPHSLIFDGPLDATHDEWASLDQIRDAVTPYLTQITS